MRGPTTIFGLSHTTDRIVAIVLVLAILGLLAAFFMSPDFFEWAFERHQNTASWIARPLLVLPLCYCAWKRSPAGIAFSLLALLTSMFWFPPPTEPRADVQEFLEMERRIFQNGWTAGSVLGLFAVVAYATGLVSAFWRRSWKLGLAVALAGAAAKIAWSSLASPGAGHAVIPYAVAGAIVLVVALALLRKRLR